MTEAEIIEVLKLRHQPQSWAFFPLLRVGTGFGKGAGQVIDAWAMSLWPSESFRRVSYEIKVSRSDFLRELADPAKRKQALLLSNEFYFVAPKGLIKPSELPVEAGLMEFDVCADGHSLYGGVTVQAPYRDARSTSNRFLASLCRRVFLLEQEQSNEQTGQAEARRLPADI